MLKLILVFFVISCSQVQVVSPGDNGIHKVRIESANDSVSYMEAVAVALGYCEEAGRKAVFAGTQEVALDEFDANRFLSHAKIEQLGEEGSKATLNFKCVGPNKKLVIREVSKLLGPNEI